MEKSFLILFSIIFQDRFEKTLQKNLPQDRNVLIVTDKAKYHSRIFQETPTMNMIKNDMILFMTKHHNEISSSLPVKPVLLEETREANIPKKYVVAR